jgi:hypothetical protein
MRGTYRPEDLANFNSQNNYRTDKSAQIKAATKKRYVSRALGVDLTQPAVPFVRVDSDFIGGHFSASTTSWSVGFL